MYFFSILLCNKKKSFIWHFGRELVLNGLLMKLSPGDGFFCQAKLCKAVLISMFCYCLHDSLSQGQPHHLFDFYLYRLLRQVQNGSNNNKAPDSRPNDELPCYKSRSFHRQVIYRGFFSRGRFLDSLFQRGRNYSRAI